MPEFFERNSKRSKRTMDSAGFLAQPPAIRKDISAIDKSTNNNDSTDQNEQHSPGKIILLAILMFLMSAGGFFYFSASDQFSTIQNSSEKNSQPEPDNLIINPRKDPPESNNISSQDDSASQDNPARIEKPIDEPADENNFSFAILGDTQEFNPDDSRGGLQQAISSLEKDSPDFIVALGDLVSSCDGKSKCENKLIQWKNIFGHFFANTYAIMGNHDRTGKEKADALWQTFFSFPENGPDNFKELTYSFDFKNSHFIMLSSDNPKENLINSAQLDWLEKDLSKSTLEHVFVFFHEPAYPISSKIGQGLDNNPKDRDALWSILKRNQVDAVFSGHEHIQNHKKINGIDQFIFGNTDSFNHELPSPSPDEFSYQGKVFGRVLVSGSKISVSFFAVSGELLKTIELK